MARPPGRKMQAALSRAEEQGRLVGGACALQAMALSQIEQELSTKNARLIALIEGGEPMTNEARTLADDLDSLRHHYVNQVQQWQSKICEIQKGLESAIKVIERKVSRQRERDHG